MTDSFRALQTKGRKLWDTLRILCGHPLTQSRQIRTLARYAALQVRSRIKRDPTVVPFVGDTTLTFPDGMDGRRADLAVGLFEFEEMAFVLHALREEDLFVDVGANIGLYTVLVGGVVGTPCLSLEPVPNTFGQLEKNLRLNGLERLVDARNAGAGRESDTLRFTSTKGANNRVLVDEKEEGIEVPVRPLDDLIETDSGGTMVLKIDVEGWEAEVLHGAEQVLGRSDPLALIIELCEGEKYGFDEAAIDARLRDRGFIPVVYVPFERLLRKVDRHPPLGNTIYVNDLDAFAERVADSPSYTVLGQNL